MSRYVLSYIYNIIMGVPCQNCIIDMGLATSYVNGLLVGLCSYHDNCEYVRLKQEQTKHQPVKQLSIMIFK